MSGACIQWHIIGSVFIQLLLMFLFLSLFYVFNVCKSIIERFLHATNLATILYRPVYSVSQKNIPDIFSCNSRKHCRIFI